MNAANILQFHDGEPHISASVPAYTEMIQQQGFPEAHARLLRELRGWAEADLVVRSQPAEIMRQVLDMEQEMLIDAGVAGVAVQHIPYLYTVLGDLFDEQEPAFQKAVEREANLAEQAYEEAIQEYMHETGCDRLEAIHFMEGSALARLQDRQERVMGWVERIIEPV